MEENDRMPSPSIVPQDFLDTLQRFKKNHPEKWEEKYRTSARRVLSSLFFFASAKRCYKEENKLLSAIGYYYSLFHISKALLFLLPNYSIDKLKKISHKKVFNLIKSSFVQRKMLSPKFCEEFDYLRQIREVVNYEMGVWIGLYRTLKDEEPELLSCINEAISVFKEICQDNIGHISAIIGDGIGDDLMDSYLSKNEAEEVVRMLLQHGLTT